MWNFHLLCALPNKARVSVSKMLSFINAGPYRACDAQDRKQWRVIYRRDNHCLLISRVSFSLSGYLSASTFYLLIEASDAPVIFFDKRVQLRIIIKREQSPRIIVLFPPPLPRIP